VSRFISTFVSSSKHVKENTLLFSKPPLLEEERFTDRWFCFLHRITTTEFGQIDFEPSDPLRRSSWERPPRGEGRKNVIRDDERIAEENHMYLCQERLFSVRPIDLSSRAPSEKKWRKKGGKFEEKGERRQKQKLTFN